MEGGAVTKSSFLYRLVNFDGDQTKNVFEPKSAPISDLLQNFILPKEKDSMVIDDDMIHHATPVFATSVETTQAYLSNRTKSLQEAKNAFFCSTMTVNSRDLPPLAKKHITNLRPNTQYAQITVANKSEDSRITGGGIEDKEGNSTKCYYSKVREAKTCNKKPLEQQTRKVSFKIKNSSTSHKRTTSAGKTTVTITSNKVAELTRKFNEMVQEKDPHKFAKTIENIQNLSRSNSSTPSSTLSSGASTSIRIIVRKKKSNKNRDLRKRCSSVDSIDKIVFKESPLPKRKVLRTKSDGNRKNKSPRKKLHYPETKKSNTIDTVDGFSQSISSDDNIISESNTVQNAIKKFESEIIATSNTINKDKPKSNVHTTEASVKPKVPVKKSSLFVTKNVVLKDGVPKIKTLKQTIFNENVNEMQPITIEANIPTQQTKDLTIDRRKYKTSFVHRSKLSLKAVEIIHEDIIDNNVFDDCLQCPKATEEEKQYQDIAARITPNESFLWRRKSSCLSNSDLDSTSESNLYSLIHDQKSKSLNEVNKIDLSNETINETLGYDVSETSSIIESRVYLESIISNCDGFPESKNDVIEALNEEVILSNSSKAISPTPDDDYETFETVNEAILEVTIPVKTSMERQSSKINCPLPEIPKEPLPDAQDLKASIKENIYHCLLEMRSHPEGDESSIHSYELCNNELEERTRGDGDSDDGYEYCKSPPTLNTSVIFNRPLTDPKPLPPPPKKNTTNYEISKSVSTASTVSYEKIGGDAIYERISSGPSKSKHLYQMQPGTRDSIISSEYNDGENIYDTIKPPDGASISNCYESIPNSPSMVKLRNNFRKHLASVVQKRMSFDSMSNVSQSTLSSEQKTNSIYGQRSMISFSGQEIAFQVPNSDTSTSDRSDRSDDWVDMSDPEEERAGDSKIIIVHERSRGRKSPVSWSQKVRHQWHKSPKKRKQNVSITSPSSVYIDTSVKSRYYSGNDEAITKIKEKQVARESKENQVVKLAEMQYWLIIKTVTRDRDAEIQDLSAFIEGDSSDSGHHYESLNVGEASAASARTPRVPTPYDDSFDSFDSDSDVEQGAHAGKNDSGVDLGHAKLPDPPPGNIYTLTKFASVARRVAGKKMRELTRNFTKRHSDYGKSYPKSPPSNGHSEKELKPKSKSVIYENYEKRQDESRIYGNIPSPEQKTYSPALNNKTENPLLRNNGNAFNNELKERLNEKRLSTCYGEVPPPLPEKLSTPTSSNDQSKGKDSGTLSRKTYFSFKSRFRRASSMAIDMNSEVPSALKITNSTFYLTDSMDGDSGFSNCSDNAPTNGGSVETLQPIAPSRKNRAESGTDRLSLNPKPHPKYESSPNLTVTEERHRIQRPNAPPPPPPPATDLTAVNQELKRLLPSLSKKDKSPRTRTSWYAECGQLDSEQPRNIVAVASRDRPTSSSWYAEVGLYQAGNISNSSSGASSGSHPASPLPQHSLFTSEPLYQFYNAAKVESVCRENVADSDSDGYEAVNEIKKKVEQAVGRTSAMSLVSPLRGPSRTLWCEIPEVFNSPVLNALTPSQKRLQEAKFELITSEASYLNSLSVLESHFIGHPAFRDEAIISGTDREILFGTIIPVRKCSQLFMNELEKCWQDNILLHGLCELVKKHAQKHFDVYIKYCENQIFLVKTLQRLKSKPQFHEILTQLESHPACQCLSLHSFLMLPMQRVTRLPLLMDAVLRNLDPADDEYQTCMDTLATLNNFVSQCNEGARNMERIEEMYRLSSCIEFPPYMRNAPGAVCPELAPSCSRSDNKPVRWLVRSGELTQLIWRGDEQLKLTFGKKFQKVPLFLFLFTDLLVITKKRSEESYTVVDYCQRSLIEISSGDVLTQLNVKETPGKHVMLLTLLENHENKTVEMLMSCANETDASRWREAMAPPGSEAGECVYAGWDCPQVAVVYAYAPTQPDELALVEGDIVNVTRKMPEGWYYGERIRDGETGWFPGSYTVEIASPHVRARNLRQRYRLLALSGSYLGQRKKT